MAIRIIEQQMSRAELQNIANECFGDLVKAVVDIKQGVLAVGPELHADAQTLLIDTVHSRNEDTWGINLYPATSGESFLEFDSLINLKPAFGNRTRSVESEAVQHAIKEDAGL